jgi:hypothetical protein
LSHSHIAFRGRRLDIQRPSGAASPANTNPDGREAQHNSHTTTLQGDAPKREVTETPPSPAPEAGAWVFTRIDKPLSLGRGPPRRCLQEGERRQKNAAIIGSDPRLELGFHPELLLARRNALASMTSCATSLCRRPPTSTGVVPAQRLMLREDHHHSSLN